MTIQNIFDFYLLYAASLISILNIEFTLFIYKIKLIDLNFCLFLTSLFLVVIGGNVYYSNYFFSYLLLLLSNLFLFIGIIRFRKNWILATFIVILKYGMITITWLICYDTPAYFMNSAKIKLLPAANFILQIFTFTLLIVVTHLVNEKFPNFFGILFRTQKKKRLFSVVILVIFMVTAFFRQAILAIHYFSDVWFFFFFFLTLLSILYLSLFISEKNILNTQLNYLLDKQKKNFSDLQQFKHDYRSILYSLDAYLEHGNLESADRYLKEILAYSDTILLTEQQASLNKINLIELKMLVSETLKKMASTSITTRLIVDDSIFLLDINMIDFVRCISIVLNNAVEELTHSPESENSFLEIKIFRLKNKYHFRVTNSTQHKYQLAKLLKKNWSTKNTHSGLGLYNLNMIIQQYNNVSYRIENSNESFMVELVVPSVTSSLTR